jgi:hypothetical protein
VIGLRGYEATTHAVMRNPPSSFTERGSMPHYVANA